MRYKAELQVTTRQNAKAVVGMNLESDFGAERGEDIHKRYLLIVHRVEGALLHIRLALEKMRTILRHESDSE